MSVELVVNGQTRPASAVARLLDVLREQWGISSVREGCGEGVCGACVVLVGGAARLSCLLLAGRVDGEITTLEGLDSDAVLGTVVAELCAHAAVQCGYCAPGVVLETYAECVAAGLDGGTPVESRADRVLRDHVCRCSGYVRLRAGICSAIGKAREETVISPEDE